MDVRQLSYFVAICESRNLSHAADRCNVAASALSHQISGLEKELETPLFTRKPRGMEPTAAGLTLLKHARSIIDAVAAAAEDVRTGQAEVSGTIEIGMPYSIIQVIGGPLMRHVMDALPRARLVLHESLSGVGYRSLRQREVQMALIFNPPPDSQTERVALLEEELVCIGHPDLLGTDPGPIRLDEMTDLPLALLQSGVLSRALVDRPGDLARLETGARIQLASVAATLAALREGLACTLAPRVLAGAEIAEGSLRARPVTEPAPRRTLYLLTPSDDRPTALRERMGEAIRDQVTAAVTEGRWPGARLV